MNQEEAKGILEGKKAMFKKHVCPDGQAYLWISKKLNPSACPRCKSRLDYPKRDYPSEVEFVNEQKRMEKKNRREEY